VLHLRILGSAAVLSSDGALTGAAGRRRALALLALVASARDDGLPRDRALALLWPELDSERARNNLKQLVFSLRRALSPDVFAATGPSLRLDPNVITVDVWAYEKAIALNPAYSAYSNLAGVYFAATLLWENLPYVAVLLAPLAVTGLVAGVGAWRHRMGREPVGLRLLAVLVLAGTLLTIVPAAGLLAGP